MADKFFFVVQLGIKVDEIDTGKSGHERFLRQAERRDAGSVARRFRERQENEEDCGQILANSDRGNPAGTQDWPCSAKNASPEWS
jgi:hypothetical protein